MLIQHYEESKENQQMSAAEAAAIMAQKRSKTPQDLPYKTYQQQHVKQGDSAISQMSKSFHKPDP